MIQCGYTSLVILTSDTCTNFVSLSCRVTPSQLKGNTSSGEALFCSHVVLHQVNLQVIPAQGEALMSSLFGTKVANSHYQSLGGTVLTFERVTHYPERAVGSKPLLNLRLNEANWCLTRLTWRNGSISFLNCVKAWKPL